MDTIFYVIFSEDWQSYLKAAYEEWLSDENQIDGKQRVPLAAYVFVQLSIDSGIEHVFRLIEQRRTEAISRNTRQESP